MTCPSPRWTLCLSGLLGIACAAGAAVWYVSRPSAGPPPLPELSQTPDGGPEAEHDLKLAEPERQFLWEVEHHGNVLNSHGFRRLADALRDADGRALAGMLADDFKGELPREPHEVRLHNEVVDVVRREPGPSAGGAARVGRPEFVAQLLDYRRHFAGRPPAVQLVVKSLLPGDRARLEGAWEGLAQLRLFGESHPGRPCEVVAILRYEVARPTREALARPGWLRGAAVAQDLVARATHYLLPDVARERGLDPSLFHDNWLKDPDSPDSHHIATGGVFVCDFDRDGYLDLLVTDLNRYALYRGGKGGRFADVTASVGLPVNPTNVHALSGVACWIDIDGDGWEDLVLGDTIYRNEAGTRFVNYNARAHLPLPADTISLVVADYDRDGRPDVYATRAGGMTLSWLTGRCGPSSGNHLFRNKGDWQFEDVTRASGTDGDHRSSFTAVWLDANDDGWPDLHVINEFGNGVLLENRGDGTFRPHALGPGPTDYGSMGVAAGDVDNDGHIDLYCANMYSKAGKRIIGNLSPGSFEDGVMAKMRRLVAGSQMHLNKGDFRFEQAGERLQVNGVGWAYGPTLADLDNDGWLDVFGTAGQISRDRNKPDG
jgi:hypothetical protein